MTKGRVPLERGQNSLEIGHEAYGWPLTKKYQFIFSLFRFHDFP